jgi:hypothetical protein
VPWVIMKAAQYVLKVQVCIWPARNISVSLAYNRTSDTEVSVLVVFSTHVPKLYTQTNWPVSDLHSLQDKVYSQNVFSLKEAFACCNKFKDG